MLYYSSYKEYCRKCSKMSVKSELGDTNYRTVFTVKRNSLKYDVLSLQVHMYHLLQKH